MTLRSQLLRLELLLEASKNDPLFAGKTLEEIKALKKEAKIALEWGKKEYKKEKEDANK